MNKQQFQQYHHFIEISGNRTKLAQKFPIFEYMEQRIKINYKQLKKIKSLKNIRPNDKFTEYFKSLEKQQQIQFYLKWLKSLNYVVLNPQINQQKIQQQTHQLQKHGQILIKKSIMNKWQKRLVNIQNLILNIQNNNKIKSYPLYFYAIRKSKNKQFYSFVLEVINDKGQIKLKNINCGFKNKQQYKQWYQFFDRSIDFSRSCYFFNFISKGADNDHKNQKHQNIIKKKIDSKIVLRPMKTLTQLTIDNHMKIQQTEINQEVVQSKKEFSLITNNEIDPKNKDPKNKNRNIQKLDTVKHPNIFKRLFPNADIKFFTQDNPNMTLLQNGQGYRMFQLTNINSPTDFKFRINILLSFNKSLVFKALNQQITYWNNQIDIFSIKTKISSQNSALIYQKDKSQGLLYRERDYLYFRNCYSQKPKNSVDKNKIFIADKSIDSINFPPFMKIVRGEKNLIWCIYGNQDQKQSMLILEGNIKGGGYMNVNNDKQMTIKFLKKLLGLENYLKEKKFVHGNKKQNQIVFQQNWEVTEQQNFYDVSSNLNESFQSCSSNQQQEIQNQQQKSKQLEEPCNNSPQKNQNINKNQFQQFMVHTSQQTIQVSQIQKKPSSQYMQNNFQNQKIPPISASDKTVIIPQNYLKRKHILIPLQKQKNPTWYPHFRGHHIWKGQWAVCPTGGLNYVDQEKMNQQKKVLTFIIKRIGKNILSGKGILNISLPVDIFCRYSNIQKLSSSFGYAPVFLQKAAKIQNPTQQLNYVIGSGILSSLVYITMQKPFNPILGQTYQSWIDGCPIYFQQISHHPPIAAYLMIGRGYKISGTIEAKMDLSINSGSGTNEGIFTIEFENGRKFHYTTPTGELTGLTYGQRKLLFVGKSFYWNIQDGLFLQIQFNPSSKNRRFFGGSSSNQTGQYNMHDYIEGTLKKFHPQDLRTFLTPKKGDLRENMLIPKTSPPYEPISQIYRLRGRWTKYILFNDQKIFDVDQNRYYPQKDQQYPLPSHSNYRQDLVYRRLNECVVSQQFKQILQEKQRKDRKLREIESKKRK